ncbi:hypothetical protein F2Q70_00035239 [Brassica cretica]|uniref:Uncharacterized protein n=1 Tax=Brassica cretica TaxID=69181 RepID=A0A8S9JYZ2_BRACR|nr:hypothetical protein F2Q68_00030324 [Brassica cretica]KAF2587334.1 hypothetical protein F2Q70_00035239 [Brassica cretica]
MDPTFYYPDPDSTPPDIRIYGSDPDRISDRIRIESRIESGSRIKVSGLGGPLQMFHKNILRPWALDLTNSGDKGQESIA